ncbi:MAG: hypothetical protein ACRDTT_24020, partial [Pseudonocardiaceae bacterium]
SWTPRPGGGGRPATDLPPEADGVLDRHADGGEAPSHVDGLPLDLDGKGNVLVNGSNYWSGIFMVIRTEVETEAHRAVR